MKHQRKLKGFWIDPAFQAKFLGLIASLLFVFAVVFMIAISLFFKKFETLGISAAFPPNHEFFVFLEKQRVSMEITMSIAFAVILLIGLVVGLWFSHRIAGPIYSLKQSLALIREQKKLQTIRFRDNDFFLEVPDAFNDMVEALERKEV